METAKLFKQGGSVVVAIPAKYRRLLNWSAGDEVGISLMGNLGVQIIRKSYPGTRKSELEQEYLFGKEKEDAGNKE